MSNFNDGSYKSGGIIYKKAGVCQAYAYAYQYILNQLGIECFITSSSTMNHAWNIIEINHHYYHSEKELYTSIEEFAYVHYNHERPHSYNNYKTPFEARYGV